MVEVKFQLEEGVLARFHQDPDELAAELRVAAAVKWYELARISQGRAAEVAGISRAELIAALGRYGVSPFQQSAEEVAADGRAAADG